MNGIAGKRIFTAVLAGAVLGLSGCATGPDVHADYDKSVDFTAYKTFGYVSPLGTDRNGYQSIVSQHLKAATKRELEARGMRYDESSPQLLVNFSGKLSDKMRVDTYAAPMTMNPYYGYRGGYYSSWPMYANEQRVTSYTEGTLNIDVIDAKRKQLVWEGTAVDAVTQKTLENIQPAIDAFVVATFKKYPVPGPAAAK
jgi:hypothetical protein